MDVEHFPQILASGEEATSHQSLQRYLPYLHNSVIQRAAERSLHATLWVVVELGEDGFVEELPGNHLIGLARREAVEPGVAALPPLFFTLYSALSQQLIHQAHLTQQLYLNTIVRHLGHQIFVKVKTKEEEEEEEEKEWEGKLLKKRRRNRRWRRGRRTKKEKRKRNITVS